MPQRFTTACYACHRRKTKCDLTLRGSPCSACVTNGQSSSDCVPRPSQRYSAHYGLPWCEANYASNCRFRNRAIISQRHSRASGELGPVSHPQCQIHADGNNASSASQSSTPLEDRSCQPLHIGQSVLCDLRTILTPPSAFRRPRCDVLFDCKKCSRISPKYRCQPSLGFGKWYRLCRFGIPPSQRCIRTAYDRSLRQTNQRLYVAPGWLTNKLIQTYGLD